MKVVLRPLPVAYACQGCAGYGEGAREAGARLDREGVAELVWLGSPGASPTTRFPVWSLDACGKRCARRWLEQRGVPVEGSYLVA
jgi:uncharacterized metal-binding protein